MFVYNLWHKISAGSLNDHKNYLTSFSPQFCVPKSIDGGRSCHWNFSITDRGGLFNSLRWQLIVTDRNECTITRRFLFKHAAAIISLDRNYQAVINLYYLSLLGLYLITDILKILQFWGENFSLQRNRFDHLIIIDVLLLISSLIKNCLSTTLQILIIICQISCICIDINWPVQSQRFRFFSIEPPKAVSKVR